MRTKKTILNFISDAIPQLIIAIIGLFKVKIFLTYLGEDTLGIYQLYGQFFAYLAVAEAGLGSAILYRLYKPISKADYSKINQILSGTKRIFTIIGIGILSVGILLSFNINFFIKNTLIDSQYIQFAFIIFLIANIISYFTISHKLLFDAEQKAYVSNTIFQIGAIIKSIAEIIIILLGFGLIEILVAFTIITILHNFVLVIYSRKKHKYINLNVEKNYEALKDTKHLFVHKIGTLIAYNIDIVIISKVLGLYHVVLYSAYNFIVENIRRIISKINNATIASVGNLISVEREKSYSIFLEYNSFVFFIATLICVPMFVSINSFINIWYESKIETSNILALLFTIILFYNIIRQPLLVFTTSAGLFKQTKLCTILESIINLFLSLILINYFGISGVLFATITSYIVSEFLIKPKILDIHLFKKGIKEYYYNSLKYIIIFGSLIVLGKFISTLFTINNLGAWLLISLLYFGLNSILVLGIYKLVGDLYFFERLIKLKNIKIGGKK